MHRILFVFLAGLLACSDDKEEPIVLDPTNNPTNNGSNNASNNASNNNTNNPTNNQTTDPNNLFEPVDRPDLVELLDVEVTTDELGLSTDLTFNVTENTQSIMVVAVGEFPIFWTLKGWRNGDGSAVVTDGWLNSDQGAPSLCLNCPQRISSSEGAFAAILPGNPQVTVRPGSHTISFHSFGQAGFNFSPRTSTAQVYVFAKKATTEPTTGILDLNLWFTGAEGWTAETAKTDTRFQGLLTELGRVYQQANIELGRISYNDVEGDYRVIENLARSSTDLAELFEQSARAPFDAVNVFFVDELLMGRPGQGFGVILGISGGIPGPANVMGSAKNGVAIAVKPDPQAPANPAHVTAHEVGHYLGLFHISEQNFGGFGPEIHDQLDDTPNNDITYLMHSSGSGTTLSPNQTRTMRLNHWVRHGGAE